MSSYSLLPKYKSFLLKKLFWYFFGGHGGNQEPKADLAVTVTNDATEVIPGTEVVYTVTVRNYGQKNVNGASLSEALPSALTNVEYYRDDVSPSNLLDASSLSDISVDIPAGGYTTYQVKGLVAADAVGELDYGVEVEVPEGFVDPDLSNNTASDTGDRLTPVADLSVTVDNDITEVNPGDAVTYIITVRNDGVSDVVGAGLSEFLPSSLTGVTYYEVKDNDGETVLEEIAGFGELAIDLAADSDVTYQVQGIIAADATGELEYGVNIEAPEGVTDPDSSNNLAYDQGDGVDEDGNEIDGDRIISTADLEIGVTNDLTEVIAGETVTYTVVVSNKAGAAVADAKITEFLPDFLTDVSYYFGEVSDDTFLEIGGLGDLDVALGVGESITYVVQGVIASDATGELEYGVEIVVPQNFVDPNLENNLAYDEGDGVDEDENGIDGDRIITAGVDLAVQKTFDLSTVEAIDNNGDGTADQFIASPSDQFTDSFVEYTLTVTNNGEATAQNVLLFEDLTQKNPIGLEFDQFIDLDGGMALDTDENANTLEVSFANLAAGESKDVTVRAKIDALKAFEFSALLGNLDSSADTVNNEIPEYLNILLEGKFFLSPDLNKEAGSQIVTFNQLNIQNTTEVTSDSFELNAFDNTTTSRLDITTIALDGELNNGNEVTIRSIERLGVIGSKTAYAINPDPILVNGQKLLQLGVTSPFASSGFGLNAGGTVTFEIRDMSNTAGADGIFGNADDTGSGTVVTSFNVTDGSATDLDGDASEIIAEWAVDLAFLDPSKTFKLTTSTSDTPFGLQQFVNYFDVNGDPTPANTVDTTSNSLFINTSVGESQGVLVQANVTNPFTGFGLAVGGTATFAISEVTGTAGADGIFGNADDNVAGRQLLQTLAIADGSGADLDSDAAEVSTEFLIAQSLTESTNKVFAITTSVNDPIFGAQQFTNYFDINGQAIPANTTDTTGNSLFINVGLNTFTATNGDTAFPTYNNSEFLLSGDLNDDGILDQFGASLSEFIWNKIDDPAYLADIATWETLASESNGDFADEQAIIDFLYDQFINTEVFSFENFQQGSFTLENEMGDRTTLEVTDVELSPDDGVLSNTPNSLELLVNDHGVIVGEACYSDLEKALSDLSFAEPVRLNITFKDSNGDGKVKTRLKNLEKGLNIEQNWYVGQIKIDSSVTDQVVLYSGNGKGRIDLSGINVSLDGEISPELVIEGGNSKDSLVGSVMGETIEGSNGKDILSGFDGDDHLVGGRGFDILNGDRGDDVLTGGKSYYSSHAEKFKTFFQRDKFVFEGDFGNDTITDFSVKDKLDLSYFDLHISDFDTNGDRHINGNDASGFVGFSGGDLLLDLSSVGGGTILFEDVHSIKANTVIV